MVKPPEAIVPPNDIPVSRQEETETEQLIEFCGVTFTMSEIRRIDLDRDGNIITIRPAPEGQAMGFGR